MDVDVAPASSAPPLVRAPLQWQNRFSRLGGAFYARIAPQPLPAPYWVARSTRLGETLGLPPHWLASEEALAVFAGNAPLAGSAPLASVYGGHQFGHWAGQLGDGRAILLGEVLTPSGEGMELQLKGSGLTPFSRMGDGRAVLRSSIREFLASEAMHALGVPTTRALCIVGSPAPVLRETVETAAVVTRAAPSFLRFGHFEYFAWRGKTEELRALLDYAVTHFYPECERQDVAETACTLLAAVTERTAELLAHWQAVGFCHGVMNTDNMSLLGLTLDYGPFAFLDAFEPGHICNHTDVYGRYAFDRQPEVARWNLYCLAEALLPLIGEPERAVQALTPYPRRFAAAFEARMRAKLGLTDAQPSDGILIDDVLALLVRERVDYTIFWRRLSQHIAGDALAPVRDLFLDRLAFDTWMLRYSERLSSISRRQSAALMLKTNPKYILRKHLAEEVIRAASASDFAPLARLQTVLESPFDEHPGCESLADFPPDWAAQLQLSCSS